MDRALLIKRLNEDCKHWTPEDTEKLLKASLDKHGDDDILVTCIKECSELTKELTKMLRREGDWIGVVEELTDVLICSQYIQMIFNISDEALFRYSNVKLNRLEEKIKAHKCDD